MGTLGENSLRTRIGRYHGRRDILISASHEIILNLLIEIGKWLLGRAHGEPLLRLGCPLICRGKKYSRRVNRLEGRTQ